MRGTLEERFWDKVIVTDNPNGCWMWQGARTVGYGMMWGGADVGRSLLAHRVSYEMHIGPIPDGMQLDHLCRNPGCVNPNHLEPVTGAENVRRGLSGWRNKQKTHCDHGHEFTEENTYIYATNGKRRCKTCARRWDREFKDRARSSILPSSAARSSGS